MDNIIVMQFFNYFSQFNQCFMYLFLICRVDVIFKFLAIKELHNNFILLSVYLQYLWNINAHFQYFLQNLTFRFDPRTIELGIQFRVSILFWKSFLDNIRLSFFIDEFKDFCFSSVSYQLWLHLIFRLQIGIVDYGIYLNHIRCGSLILFFVIEFFLEFLFPFVFLAKDNVSSLYLKFFLFSFSFPVFSMLFFITNFFFIISLISSSLLRFLYLISLFFSSFKITKGLIFSNDLCLIRLILVVSPISFVCDFFSLISLELYFSMDSISNFFRDSFNIFLLFYVVMRGRTFVDLITYSVFSFLFLTSFIICRSMLGFLNGSQGKKGFSSSSSENFNNSFFNYLSFVRSSILFILIFNDKDYLCYRKIIQYSFFILPQIGS